MRLVGERDVLGWMAGSAAAYLSITGRAEDLPWQGLAPEMEVW